MSDNPTHNFDLNNTRPVCKDVCDIEGDGEEFSLKKEIMTLGLGIIIYAGVLKPCLLYKSLDSSCKLPILKKGRNLYES